MFGSCQFLCLFIACLFSVFLKSFVYLLPVCVIFWVTFCSLSLCSNSCHWVECFLLTGQGTVSSVCFCLLQTWSKSLGLFFQDVLCICLFFRVSYRYSVCSGSLPPSCSPTVTTNILFLFRFGFVYWPTQVNQACLCDLEFGTGHQSLSLPLLYTWILCLPIQNLLFADTSGVSGRALRHFPFHSWLLGGPASMPVYTAAVRSWLHGHALLGIRYFTASP